MIGRLRGIIEGLDEETVLIDVGGVGYVVHASPRTLGALPRAGHAATLQIETHVREDAIMLYGFATDVERAWFRRLTSVQGVGPRLALAILGALRPHELSSAIALQDKSSVTRAPGVGPRLAQRIVNELKDKVLPESLAVLTRMPSAEAQVGAVENDGEAAVRRDAISALVNLGYGMPDASRAALSAWGRGARDIDALIRDALRELAR